MEVKCKDISSESRSLITAQCEIVYKSNVLVNDAEQKSDENNQVQLEDSIVRAEDSNNLIDNGTYLESSITSITNGTDSHTPSCITHNNDAMLLLEEKISSVTSDQVECNNIVKIAESKDIDSRDTESINSIRFQYNWFKTPRLLCAATEEYKPTDSYENFTKGCQWSPDGTCLLVPSDDFRIRIYELPKELYSGHVPSDFMQARFTPVLTVKEGGLIYDTCWYPFMNSWDPATCCFLSASKENPVHLWDAYTGELRATYRAYNQVDEVEASISVQFVDSRREIWCGFKNAVRTFNTDRPGRQTNTIQFKHDFPNMIGLVSCIRENPIMPGLVAFGTYSKCIGLYKDGPLCVFKTESGVTQVEFSSCGMKLFSAVRKNSEFLCWDLRNPGTVLYSLQGRQSDTNQRIQFALTPDKKEIISGGTDGNITVWELPEVDCNEDLNLRYKIKLSKDCINGTSLHKNLPIIATSSGQRQCGVSDMHRDNSVRLWWVS